MQIAGSSMAARAQVAADPVEAEKALHMLNYPQQVSIPPPMPAAADVHVLTENDPLRPRSRVRDDRHARRPQRR